MKVKIYCTAEISEIVEIPNEFQKLNKPCTKKEWDKLTGRLYSYLTKTALPQIFPQYKDIRLNGVFDEYEEECYLEN